ncbi:MAG: YidC/Oxa1 family insertase periplasmic-domain containing protein [Pirellulales bacterium]|nr:YidC/Oxa1 family insertase periplasmic-domain containing protein [Pirellulales bacterium]
MERRFVIFLVLSFLFMAGYMALLNKFRGPEPQPPAAAKPEKPGPAPAEKEKEAVKDPEAVQPEKAPEKPEPQKPAPLPEAKAKEKPPEVQPPPEPIVAEQCGTLGSLDPQSGYRMLVTWTNRGAAIRRIELNSLRYCDIDDRSGYLGYLVMDQSDKKAGCRVQAVGPGTPAAEAGLKSGDLIKELNGRPVTSASALETALEKTRPGENAALTIARGGKQQELQVTLRRRPLEVVRPEGDDPPSMLMTLQQFGEEKINDDEKKPETNLSRELKGVSLRSRTWRVVRSSAEEVVFSRTLPQAGVEVFKTYRLAKAPPEAIGNPDFPAYHLDLEIKIVNHAEQAQNVAYRLDGPTGVVMEGAWYAYKVSRNWGGAGLRDYLIRFEGKDPEMVPPAKIAKHDVGPPQAGESVAYVGVDAQYFSAMLIPQKQNPGDIWFASSQSLLVGPVDEKHLDRTDVSFRVTSLAKKLNPEESLTQKFQLFAGPKKPSLLAGYGLDQCVYYGWFGWVAKPMLSILHTFYMLLPNYGIAIILLTVLVRSCMFPLSVKQTLGAQKMQMIQPEMKKIMEKYKKDLEGRTKAMQELYRKHNYHPASGCLPMFIQLPIFLGLYRALMVDVELRDAPLLSHAVRWCSNLAAPDMLFNWTGFMPTMLTEGPGFFGIWLGPYFNILPIVTVFLFLWQQKKMMPPATDDQQAMQQKLMKFMMIFMGVLFFKVASGLCVYFVATTLWGIGERKFLPKKSEDGAAPPQQPSRPWWRSWFGSDGDADPARRRKERRRKG